jgi:predicted HNH restriction endonuclease
MHWKKEEIEILRNSYLSKKYVGEIAKELNKSVRAIHHKAARIGLSRNPVKIKHPSNKKIIDQRYYEKNKEEVYKRKRERIRNYKLELLKRFGEKCSVCGYNKCVAALEFHHTEKNKDVDIKKALQNLSKQKALKEAEKCIILCANCHRETHHRDLIN